MKKPLLNKAFSKVLNPDNKNKNFKFLDKTILKMQF